MFSKHIGGRIKHPVANGLSVQLQESELSLISRDIYSVFIFG